jgi:type IV secretion system protein VirB10
VSTADSHDALEHGDLNIGDQPVDINAIGVNPRRFPVRMVVFGVVVIGLLLAGFLWFAQHWVGEKLRPKVTAEKHEDLPFSNASSKVQLPDANTPLGGDVTDVNNKVNGEKTGKSSKSLDGQNSRSADCATTQLVDKNTGQAVRNAQSQPVMIDCNGAIQGVVVPAAQTNSNTATAANGVGANGWSNSPSTLGDRYSGDTVLAPKKSTNTTTGVAASVAPPQSAALMDSLLRMNNPARSDGGAANAVLSQSGLGQGSGSNGASGGASNTQGSVGGMLLPASTPKAMAVRSMDANLTIPKGGAIDCNMTTRVVTEISGFTSCMVSQNVYSANGRVLLIERMSEVQGEYGAVGQLGQRRVYVLWSRIRKPDGSTIDIASPSTDSLGAAGIDGVVDNRWFERIGSAYMLSIFKDFLAASAASQAGPNNSGGTVLYQNSLTTSNSLAEKVLSQSINIKPVVYAHQGARVSIYVARDLDFSSIYEIQPIQ